ncbi:MAG: hypothetical protein ACRCY8_02320 [Dermatophilaceae bacterium]
MTGEYDVGAFTPVTLQVFAAPWVLCDLEGRIVIRELAFTDDGQVASMALDWAGDCDGQRSGQVRVNSDVPYGGIDVEYGHRWEMVSYVGEVNAPYDVVVTGHGTEAPAIHGVEVADAASSNFVIMHGTDSCTGAALGHTETCRVTVASAPRTIEQDDRIDYLVIRTVKASAAGPRSGTC